MRVALADGKWVLDWDGATGALRITASQFDGVNFTLDYAGNAATVAANYAPANVAGQGVKVDKFDQMTCEEAGTTA